MNNEEKILALLEQMSTRQDRAETLLEQLQQGQNATNARLDNLEQGQKALEQGQNAMQTDISEMKTSIDNLEGRVAALQKDMTHHNHYVEPLLQSVKEGLDGWQERNRQIDQLEQKVDSHDDRIWALEQLKAQ